MGGRIFNHFCYAPAASRLATGQPAPHPLSNQTDTAQVVAAARYYHAYYQCCSAIHPCRTLHAGYIPAKLLFLKQVLIPGMQNAHYHSTTAKLNSRHYRTVALADVRCDNAPPSSSLSHAHLSRHRPITLYASLHRCPITMITFKTATPTRLLTTWLRGMPA